MKKLFTMQKHRIVPILAAIVIAAVGGMAVAGNMAFQITKPIVFAGSGQIGNNWTSIPYLQSYGNAGAFCTATGLISTGKKGSASITVLDESTGAYTTVLCGTSAANALTLVPGKGIQISQPNTSGAPSSIPIFGSHDPSRSITVPKAGKGQIGNYWFSVPYHATALTANDLCLQAGLTSTGITRASITRLNASTGVFSTVSCGSSGATALNLVLGEFVQLRDPNGPRTFIPDHF